MLVGYVLQHSNPYGLFKPNSYSYVYIKYKGFVNEYMSTIFLNRPELICMHTVKWFKVLQSDINSFIFSRLNGFKDYYVIPWCNDYRRRKWTRRLEFKSWTRLIAFHIAPIPLVKIPLVKVWI